VEQNQQLANQVKKEVEKLMEEREQNYQENL
jgi:hypothetical protein